MLGEFGLNLIFGAPGQRPPILVRSGIPR